MPADDPIAALRTEIVNTVRAGETVIDSVKAVHADEMRRSVGNRMPVREAPRPMSHDLAALASTAVSSL